MSHTVSLYISLSSYFLLLPIISSFSFLPLFYFPFFSGLTSYCSIFLRVSFSSLFLFFLILLKICHEVIGLCVCVTLILELVWILYLLYRISSFSYYHFYLPLLRPSYYIHLCVAFRRSFQQS
jgi:hypothetical protein